MAFAPTVQSLRFRQLTVKDRVSRATVSGRFDTAKDRLRELPATETLWVLSPPPFLS
jgi:hypothetical protein